MLKFRILHEIMTFKKIIHWPKSIESHILSNIYLPVTN